MTNQAGGNWTRYPGSRDIKYMGVRVDFGSIPIYFNINEETHEILQSESFISADEKKVLFELFFFI